MSRLPVITRCHEIGGHLIEVGYDNDFSAFHRATAAASQASLITRQQCPVATRPGNLGLVVVTLR